MNKTHAALFFLENIDFYVSLCYSYYVVKKATKKYR